MKKKTVVGLLIISVVVTAAAIAVNRMLDEFTITFDDEAENVPEDDECDPSPV